VKITVRVKPNSRTEGVFPSEDGTYTVRVTAPPADGRANERVILLLSRHFGVPRSKISISRGFSGRTKVIDIF